MKIKFLFNATNIYKRQIMTLIDIKNLPRGSLDVHSKPLNTAILILSFFKRTNAILDNKKSLSSILFDIVKSQHTQQDQERAFKQYTY